MDPTARGYIVVATPSNKNDNSNDFDSLYNASDRNVGDNEDNGNSTDYGSLDEEAIENVGVPQSDPAERSPTDNQSDHDESIKQMENVGAAPSGTENNATMPPGARPPFVYPDVDFTDPVWKWHRRLSHIGLDNLRKLLYVAEGIDLTDKQIKAKLGMICPICATTKAVNRVLKDPTTRR